VELADRAEMRFPEEEYQRRLVTFREALAAEGVDVYLGSLPEHMNYFTGFDPTGLYFYQKLFLTPGSAPPVLLTHKCEQQLARVTSWLEDVRIWTHGQDPVEITVAILTELGLAGGMTLGLEMESWYLKPATVKRLETAFPGVRIVDVTWIGQEQRMRKSPLEIAYIRQAARFADIGMAAAVEQLRPGVRELDIHAEIQRALATAGSEYPALPTIMGSGPRSGLFHALPSERVVQDGDPVMFEITGSRARYNSNIVRTLVAGAASDELKTLWDVVTGAFWAGFEITRPGTPVGEIDRVTREARKDYADFIPARAGFGMELAYPPVWLGRPDILEGDEHVLEPGMVFSLEPSVAMYRGVSMIFGFNILVTIDGAEILHRTPADLFEVRSGRTS
jgi:Xaa-Pro dipeptidase